MLRVLLLFSLLTSMVGVNGQTGMKALLPFEGEIPGWEIISDIREYEGEELNGLLGREAELFYEYGFRSAVIAKLSDSGEEQIEMRIYRMEDTFASYALYLNKSAGAAATYTSGNNAFIKDNSLGFWKHHFFVLISGNYEEYPVEEGIKMVADLIDSRIKPSGRLPEITGNFRDRPGRITLIRGKLALSNIYHFTSLDVFRIEEGVAIEEPGFTEIWLRYADSGSSIRRLGEVAGVLSRESMFTGFIMSGEQSFRLNDNMGNAIDIEATGRYLKIVISSYSSLMP